MATINKKVDRRVLRTRNMLYAALLELMMEGRYDEITVSDIADRANVGRATFYLHYRDKDDLLASNIEGMFAEIAERIRPLLRRAMMSGQPLPSIIIFNEVEQNAPLYRMILSGQGGTVVWHRLYQTVIDLYGEIIQALVVGGDSPIEVGLLANYVVGALLSIIKWWLEDDRSRSAEYMAAVWKRMIQPSMMEVILLDENWYAAENG